GAVLADRDSSPLAGTVTAMKSILDLLHVGQRVLGGDGQQIPHPMPAHLPAEPQVLLTVAEVIAWPRPQDGGADPVDDLGHVDVLLVEDGQRLTGLGRGPTALGPELT